MAKGLQIKLSGDWDKWRQWVNSFDGNLSKASERAVRKSLQLALKEIDSRIRDGKYEKLAALTRLGRRMDGYGSTPLLRTGGLVRSINTEVVNSFQGSVGLVRSDKGGANLGELLHEGGTIPITQAMKRAFARKFGKLKTRSTGKTAIRIPPRRFIQSVFDDSKFQMQVEKIFRKELADQLGF